jgi:hypothetical protein
MNPMTILYDECVQLMKLTQNQCCMCQPCDLIEGRRGSFSRLSVVINEVVITALTVMITSFDNIEEQRLQLKIVT